MNSSDEEKQLQLISSLKEQGRRARGRQVRAGAARGRGRLPGAGSGLRRAGWAVSRPPRSPRSPVTRAGASCALRAPRGARGRGSSARVGRCSAGGAPRRSAVGGRGRDLGRTRTRGTTSPAGEAGGLDVSGGDGVGSPAAPRSPAPAPPLHTGAGRPAAPPLAACPAFQSASG